MRINLKPMLVLFFLTIAISAQAGMANFALLDKDSDRKSTETLTEKHYQDFEAFVNKLDKSDMQSRTKIMEYYLGNVRLLQRSTDEKLEKKMQELYHQSYLDAFNAQYARAQKQRDEDRKTTPSLSVVFTPIDLLFQTDGPPPTMLTQEDVNKVVYADEREVAMEKKMQDAAFASEPFGAYLKGLNPQDFHSIALSVERYKNSFKDKPETQRVEGFNKLRAFVDGYGRTMTIPLMTRLHAFLKGEDHTFGRNATALEKERYAMDAYFLLLHKKVLGKYGIYIEQVDECEDLLTHIRPNFYVHSLEGLLPDYLRDYLILEDKEFVSPVIAFCYLGISIEECGRRARAWEKYQEDYPENEYKEKAKSYFSESWDYFFAGRLGSDIWDMNSETLLPDVKTAYEAYLKNNVGCPSAKKLEQIYNILKENGFKWNENFKERYKQILGFEPRGPKENGI